MAALRNFWEDLFGHTTGETAGARVDMRLVSKHGRPFMLPPRQLRVAVVSLGLFPAQTPRVRSARTLLSWHMGVAAPFGTRPISITVVPQEGFVRFITSLPGEPRRASPTVGILAGNPAKDDQRILILVFDAAQNPDAAVKAALSECALALVEKERPLLTAMPQSISNVPRLRATFLSPRPGQRAVWPTDPTAPGADSSGGASTRGLCPLEHHGRALLGRLDGAGLGAGRTGGHSRVGLVSLCDPARHPCGPFPRREPGSAPRGTAQFGGVQGLRDARGHPRLRARTCFGLAAVCGRGHQTRRRVGGDARFVARPGGTVAVRRVPARNWASLKRPPEFWPDAAGVSPLLCALVKRNAIIPPGCGMRLWLALLQSQAQDGILDNGISDSESLVPKPRALTGTGFYHLNAKLLANIARVLGKEAEALAKTIKTAFNRRFLQPGTGRYDTATQACQAFALYLGLVPPKEKNRALAVLVREIGETHRGHLSTGIFGTKFMLHALADLGRADTAFGVVNQRTFPGWGHMLENGATTLWELREFSDSTYSHNHPMFGSASDWWPESAKFKLHVRVPVGAVATVFVPAREGAELTDSGQPIARAAGGRFSGRENGSAGLNVVSGEYDFACALR